MRTPAFFISHGSPMLAIADSPARRFLAALAGSLPRPERILVASAHWETAIPAVATAPRPSTIYDFRGFDRRLYEIDYPASGDPDLAGEAASLLSGAGFRVHSDPDHGWDHGVWVPLSLLFPGADIPVAQVSIQPDAGPVHHFRMGQALAPLRDRGVMLVTSGAMTHNLREYFGQSDEAPAPEWVVGFTDWMQQKLESRQTQDLLNYRRLAPFAERNHPEDEHLLPLFVALGASPADEPVRRLHHSVDRVIAMDVYQFGS